MRCIALAQAWQDRGGNVTFLSHCDNETLRKRIIDEDFDFIPIEKPHPDPSDIIQTLNLLKRHALCPMPSAPQWLALDGYHFSPDYQKIIRENGYKLLVIDDMAHLDHYHADILLNQNIHASSLHYSYDRDTVKLLGCEYALLRREFLKYKGWKRKIPEKARRILVTLGGADPDNVTLKVVETLNILNTSDIEVKIVVGPSNPHKELLINAMRHAPCAMRLLHNVSNIPDLMIWADLAISAGGSTCWEMAFMGLPNLIITISDNQADIAKGLGKVGVSIDLRRHEDISIKQFSRQLEGILQNKNKRQKMSGNGQKLINVQGTQKIMGTMFARQIMLRRTKEIDCELLWNWANDPEVRQSAFNSKSIAWEDHQSWFIKKQNNPDCVQYIALNSQDVPVGQIRFDIKDSVAEIDYSIDKEFRDMGLGRMLLKMGSELLCEQEENPLSIQGCVKKENEPSNRSFRGAGCFEATEKAIDENDVRNSHTIYQFRVSPTKKLG